MRLKDFVQFTTASLRSHRMRSFLAALGIAVGIAAVTLLTSIGEGVHDYVLNEFSMFGTNLIAVEPGRVTTAGTSIGIFGTVRPLTMEDAAALRRAPYIEAINPSIVGDAEIAAGGKHRRVTVLGVGPEMLQVVHVNMRMGSFLPHDDPNAPRALAVLGARANTEIFGDANPLGSRIEIGGSRYRVVGVLEAKGQMLGIDRDDAIVIPTARAQELFNRDSLTGIDVLYEPRVSVDKVVDSIHRVLLERHGRDDVTIITQQKMQDVLGSVLGVLTFAVSALGSISLLVGAVGILTIMTIAVSERTAEIGTLRALGADRQQVMTLFLAEAALIAAFGGLAGLALGTAVAYLLRAFVPALPVASRWSFTLMAEAVAISTGIIFGILPARKAARVDPIEALRAE